MRSFRSKTLPSCQLNRKRKRLRFRNRAHKLLQKQKELETWNHGRTSQERIERVRHNGETSVVKDPTIGKETRLEVDMVVKEEMNNGTVKDHEDPLAQ